MERTLHAELLDALPPGHPDALRNRRDLRLTNVIMRNHAWLLRAVPAMLRPGERALELGAGTGEVGARLAARGAAVDGVDLWPRPAAWRRGQAWYRTDLRTFVGWDRYPVVFGNLIFHQLSADDLREIGARARNVRAILACEPLRRRGSQIAFAAIAPLLGANHVSLHDAHVSIAAGFRGDELPTLLGLAANSWRIECRQTFLGAYRMIAVRSS